MGKNKKKIILIVVFTIVLIIIISITCINVNQRKEKENISGSLAIYIDDGSGYKLSTSKEFPSTEYQIDYEKSICTNGAQIAQNGLTRKISVKITNQGKCNLYFEKSSSSKTLNALGLTSKTGSPDFSTVATTDETADGLYSMEDDYGTSYYFRGAVENNYVKFANFFWRIIRINGNGSLRIIYDGTSAYENGASSSDRTIGKSAFNTQYGDNAYIGYMYGLAGLNADANRCLVLINGEVADKVSNYTTKTTCENNGGVWATTGYEAAHANVKDSTIKTFIDDWYKKNIVDMGFSDAVSDELFCNDREIVTDLENSNNGIYSDYTILGYGANNTHYMTASRIGSNVSNPTPKLKCTQKHDAFTVSHIDEGNGNLTYPVGLITADEMATAGAKWQTTNRQFYLYKGFSYWSMSPMTQRDQQTGVFRLTTDYLLGGRVESSDTTEIYVVPVINLSPEYAKTLKGTGTKTNPYTAS